MEKYAEYANERGNTPMNKQVWVDLTDISGWTGNFTGIQRVVYNLAYYFYENNEAQFFKYDVNTRSFYEADFAQIIERFNAPKTIAQSSTNSPKNLKEMAFVAYASLPNSVKLAMPSVLKRGAKKAYRGARKGRRIVARYRHTSRVTLLEKKVTFNKNDTILVFGNNWDRSIFIHDVSKEKSKVGFRVFSLVYDLIPVLGPQLFGIELFSIYARFLFETVAVSDGLFCISKSTERDLGVFCERVGLPTPNTSVIRLGDSLEKTKSRAVTRFKDKNYVLCVGTLEVRKNHMLLYYAWKEAARKGIKMPHLVIVGRPGWHTENIRHMLMYDPEVADRITVIESVDDAELRWFYENCLFSVYPSMYEGWGLPIAESLSYGKLCLSSNTSSMPEIAGDLIDYFSPYDSGDCLSKVANYFNDPEKLKDKEAVIRRRYKSTSWASTYKEVKSFI